MKRNADRKKAEKKVKNLSRVLLGLSLALSPFAAVNISHALDSTNGAVEQGFVTTVRGIVRFERRNTIVPYIEGLSSQERGDDSRVTAACDDQACPHSSPYWAIVVEDGQRQYELRYPFAVGSSRAPNAIEFHGVMLRPGARVSVEGSVDSVSERYGIIFDVKNISLIPSPLKNSLETLGADYSRSTRGWKCKSLDDLRDGVNAFIWYRRDNPWEKENVHLRVVAKKIGDLGKLQQGVTEMAHVQLKELSGNLVYQGAIADTAAILAISRSPMVNQSYPSSLSVSSLHSSLGVRMICSPILD